MQPQSVSRTVVFCCVMSLRESFSEEPSLRRPAVVLVGLLVTVVIGERLLAVAVAGVRPGSSSFPVWLPVWGSIGETIVVYGLFFDFLKFIVIPAVLLWLAYQYGRHSTGN